MSLQIGPYLLDSVLAGEFRLDGGAMFGVVPKVLWEKTNPADERNRIQMALRCLLVRGEGRVLLVDTGVGGKWSEKARDIYAIDHSRYDLVSSLAKLGVQPDQVTDVILTHLHFDHVGGATLRDKGEIALTFPKATYYAQEKNLNHAHAPSEKDRASFIEETIVPLQRSGQLKVISGNKEFCPGVSAWVTHGHTPGQQLLKVTDGVTTLVCCGDTIPTASHIPLPWLMAYDLYPMTTVEEKRSLLTEASAKGWILFFVHDPFRAACRVRRAGEKFEMADEVSL